MKEVEVEKEELLAKVRENLKSHVAEYNEAIENMKKEAESYFKKQLRDIKKGVGFKRSHNFIKPENHEDDYQQVITMLEMSVDNKIKLSYSEFSRYVMDNWDWTERFKSTTSMYNG